MTVENLETNGNQTQEEIKQTENKDSVALSVKEKSDNSPKGLQLAQKPAMLPGNRPVEPSHLQVISTYRSVGGSRPVTASGMHISSTLVVSGNRPISTSTLAISESVHIMGNRPVASNQIDEDPAVLMGYLD
ncbi:MAG: hypothetical protein ACFBSE_26930 [Prochloraceae cyanobacterium]